MLWKKGTEQTKEIAKSEELVKKRGALLKKWPSVNEQWNKEDAGPVRKAAEELSIVLLMQNPSRILEAREVLKLALWKRDGLKEMLQREIDALNGEIESLNSPVIFEKANEWQKSLSSLKEKKIIEKVEVRETISAGRMVVYRSNFRTITATKEKLLSAISELRGMAHSPLSEIHFFIKRTEEELLRTDFTDLKEEAEVSERTFGELCSHPEVAVYPMGTTYTLVGNPGSERIAKTFK